MELTEKFVQIISSSLFFFFVFPSSLDENKKVSLVGKISSIGTSTQKP